ncbi:hypothetical protein Syun_015830 [Stephania yunnanensis]|uniref:Uncharacterized protein n=1 Tax=Stephania yunnanensis TaxID=152371 RepID=A0AAP0J411_9MAGN
MAERSARLGWGQEQQQTTKRHGGETHGRSAACNGSVQQSDLAVSSMTDEQPAWSTEEQTGRAQRTPTPSPARQRVGSAVTNLYATRCDATRRNSSAVAAPVAGERRCRRSTSGALLTGRMRDFDEMATTRWSFIVVHCFVMIAIVEIVVDRVSPMANESRLLFICYMSSYPDAIDIS